MTNNPSLRTFLDLLTRENEIITIKAEVDPYLELAEIHRRVISEGGPALLFDAGEGKPLSRRHEHVRHGATHRSRFWSKAGSVRARDGSHCRVDPAAKVG